MSIIGSDMLVGKFETFCYFIAVSFPTVEEQVLATESSECGFDPWLWELLNLRYSEKARNL